MTETISDGSSTGGMPPARRRFREWYAQLPFEVRHALAQADAAGIAVDEGYEDGPVLYETPADYLTCTSLGSALATVTAAVKATLEPAVDGTGIAAVLGHIRREAMSTPWPGSLACLMRWCPQDPEKLDGYQ